LDHLLSKDLIELPKPDPSVAYFQLSNQCIHPRLGPQPKAGFFYVLIPATSGHRPHRSASLAGPRLSSQASLRPTARPPFFTSRWSRRRHPVALSPLWSLRICGAVCCIVGLAISRRDPLIPRGPALPRQSPPAGWPTSPPAAALRSASASRPTNTPPAARPSPE